VAKQLGYQPDPDMGQLMEKVRERKKHRLPSILAYITAHDTRDGWKQSTTQASYFEGASARASECGYRLDNFWLREPKMSEARLSSILSNRSIEGVIIAPFPDSEVISDAFRWDYFSAVQLGYSNLKWHLYRSCNHQFQSMKLLVQSLQQAGYRKIGLAMPASQDDRVNNHWRGAYLAGLAVGPDAPSIPLLLSSNPDKKQFTRWFNEFRPEAIVTVGTGIHKWLAEMKIKIPEEVGLANVDLTSEMGDVTGINQNSTAVGAAAVDHLVTLMRFSERGIPQVPKILMVEGTFVQGATTVPLLKH
jgi:LacI family transcriptional regulator